MRSYLLLFSIAIFLILPAEGAVWPQTSDPLLDPSPVGGPGIRIGESDIEIMNNSGEYTFTMSVDGYCGPGVEEVRCYLLLYDLSGGYRGGLNITPMELELDMLRLELLDQSTNGTWENWTFFCSLRINGGLMESPLVLLLGSLLGREPPGERLNISDLFGLLSGNGDAGSVPDALDIGSVKLLARAYAGNGSRGEDAKDLTLQLANALVGFAIQEGIIDEGDTQEDPDEDVEGTGEKSTVDILFIISGSSLLLLSLSILILIFATRKGEGPNG